MNKYILKKIKIWIYKWIIKKDTMELRLDLYRRKGVKIGEGVRAFSPLISAEPYLLEIGNNVTISTGVNFTTHDNSVIKVLENKTDVFGKIIIKDDCFIGQNSLILPGVTLGNRTIVGAGSIVTKSFKDGNVIIAGNPAKIICTVDEYKKRVRDKALNTKGLSYDEKKKYLKTNEERFIEK